MISYLIYSYTAQLYTVPIVITFVTNNRDSEQLRDRVQHQMAALNEYFKINISVIEMDRFGMAYI